MKKIKSVYIMTDLEGVCGIDDWDPRHTDYGVQAKGVYDRAEMQRLLTGEVNAAAEGLLAAGVEEVLVNDGHGAGRTILVEELISGVKLMRGTQRPCWLPGLSRRFDALAQVGMHAMAYTPNACLCHTQSKGLRYRINGREVGEMEQAAYLVGQIGIPWIFTSGDLYACREAEAWIPGMVSAAVKEGMGRLCAIHLAPVDARQLIRERIQEAVAKAAAIKPLTLEGPVVVEVENEEPWPQAINEAAERVGEHMLRYRGENIWQTLHTTFYGKRGIGCRDYPLPD